MAESTIDFDRLFLTNTSDTYKCRSGDNIFLECYVRQRRIKSIAWYVRNERVPLRGVRLWYRYNPTTGQTVLYIRSVLPCDEGSYFCEATSHDGVVETLEVKLKIDNLDKTWTKIPLLFMAGRVMSGGLKELTDKCPT